MLYVKRFDELGRAAIDLAGGKGANLGELTQARLPVPPGFVLTTAAYRLFVESNGLDEKLLDLATLSADASPARYDETAEQIRSLFEAGPVPDVVAREVAEASAALGEGPVAVRSSATAEDLEGASSAGQQDTYLNVRGHQLIARIRDCWASLWTARALAYRARQGIDPATVSLAVVVQEMVDADAAGVMFTANPANGRGDETVIAAAWGLGESVVGGTVNTDDIVVRTIDGEVLSRSTAEKSVMTVYSADGTEERPVPADLRSRPVLDDAAAAALAGIGARIEQHYGAPQDIEWARAAGTFAIVQSRPITALPEPSADAPTEWTVPDPTAFYARASIVEQLPDPLTPLFAELVDPSVTRSLQALFREFIGRDALRDTDVGLPTINGYAYYRYARGAMGRMVVKSPAAFRKLATSGDGGTEHRWRARSHPRYVEVVDRWRQRPVADMPDAELMAGVVELLDAGTEYYTAVQTIIPLAATSEVAFTSFYERAVRRADDPPAPTFLLGYDSLPIRAEKSLYALAVWTQRRPELAAALQRAPSTALADMIGSDRIPSDVDDTDWREWAARFRDHLDRYGHTVYNLDFANAVPADEPGPVLDTLRFYLRGEGTDPNERQARSASRREDATAAVLARLDPARRAVFLRLLRWAQGIAPVREDALADVGLAWPLLRGCCGSWAAGWSRPASSPGWTTCSGCAATRFWRRGRRTEPPWWRSGRCCGGANARPRRRSCFPSAAGTGSSHR